MKAVSLAVLLILLLGFCQQGYSQSESTPEWWYRKHKRWNTTIDPWENYTTTAAPTESTTSTSAPTTEEPCLTDLCKKGVKADRGLFIINFFKK